MNLPAIASVLLISASLSAEQPLAELRWNNGETISGELIGASAQAVTWKTPLFADPLELQWHVLRRIDQPEAGTGAAGPFSFSISLRDGSYILGDLIAVTDTTVAIKSKRHGDAVVQRPEVLSIRRLNGAGLIFAGPVGDVGWTESGAPKTQNWFTAPPAMPKLTAGPAGALMLPYWNNGAFFAGALPESADVEFRLRSSRRPDFRFSLEGGSNHAALNVETWDDEVVLVIGNEFHFVQKLAEADRDVSLRVCWDRKARTCFVFTAAGEKITEWQAPEIACKGDAGITLQNKGRDLALEFLRVRNWDGKAPPKIHVNAPRIELADGTVVAGQVSDVADGMVHLRADGKSSPQALPLAAVDALILSSDPPKAGEAEAILTHSDGTFLTGSIVAIEGGAAMLKTTFSEEPLRSQINGLRQIRLGVRRPGGAAPEKPLAEMDKLILSEATLHGTLAGNDSDQPSWLPIGGVRPSVPAQGLLLEINRAFPPAANLSAAPALFYTTGWDVLPGTLRALDRSRVDFESDVIAVTHLPAETFNAIQFEAPSRIAITGFDDSGWVVLKGDETTVVRTSNSLRMEPGTSAGHAAAMQASEIEFSLAHLGFSTVRLRLFCAGTDAEQATSLILSFRGNHLYSGVESGDGQISEQIRTNVPATKPVAVKLTILEQWVELSLSGVLAQRISIPASRRAGFGLGIEPAGLWGNVASAIALSGFSAQSVPGRTWLPHVNAETRMQALTVPRFRKDNPPRHALIAANGDVLRGEIESSTQSHFRFRAGLETLVVPRERIRAAVWLKEPPENAPAPAPAEKSSFMKALDQPISRRMRYGSSDLRSMIRFLQSESSSLKFGLPETQDARRFAFQFGDQTIGEALEQICALFGAKYRITDDGTIAIEAASVPLKGLAQKSWWLNRDPFAGNASAEEVLTSKGIPFPAGASAKWHASANLFSATNTLENLSHIGRVVAADLGGSLGSPTHWLLLTNGARIGLTIKSFGNDVITGSHPIYGACKIPVSQVYAVRTTMPEPTAAIRALEDWELVFAPEPVLPEAGGESSPALGKAAKIFKLPMLGGGEFDLEKEKGNVVVLDFWATWCAPCIKSLPPLIDAMSAFPADRVKLISVNQGEPAEQVQRFLEARGWKLAVAMDASQSVARQYEVASIPYTVIIGPDGKVAWVKTGYSADAHVKAAEVIEGLLGER